MASFGEEPQPPVDQAGAVSSGGEAVLGDPRLSGNTVFEYGYDGRRALAFNHRTTATYAYELCYQPVKRADPLGSVSCRSWGERNRFAGENGCLSLFNYGIMSRLVDITLPGNQIQVSSKLAGQTSSSFTANYSVNTSPLSLITLLGVLYVAPAALSLTALIANGSAVARPVTTSEVDSVYSHRAHFSPSAQGLLDREFQCHQPVYLGHLAWPSLS